MRYIGWLTAALGAALLIQGCGGGDNGPDCDPIAGALVERVEVTPATASVQLGDSLQLSARAYSCEGQLSGLPPFEWASANPTALSVSATGKVYALAEGAQVDVTASVQGKSGSARISTVRVPVARVEVTPPTAQLGVGRTSTLTVRAFDAQDRELTGRVAEWVSSNPNVVSVNAQGQVTGVAVGGPVTVTATVEGASDASAVTVVNNAVATVTVSPPSATISGGQTDQFTATLRDDQGAVLSGRAIAWTSSDEQVATIEGTGATVTVRGRRAGGPVTITATSEGRNGTAQVTVDVGQPARLAFVQEPPTSVANGQDIAPPVTVEIQDAGGNRTTSNAAVTLSLATGTGGTLGGTTTVNASSGLATFADLFVTVTAPGAFSLGASSPGLQGATSTTFTVTVPAVTITTTTLPTATRNVAYSQQLGATGGTGTFAWTVVSGSLPAGMTLSGAGVLSGTPTAAGTFNFTVRATSGGQLDDQALSLVVNQPGVQVTTTSVPAATRGTPYSQQLAATGGDGTYTWNVQNGSLPTGITLSSAGLLSGTPTVAGTFNFTVRATSAGQNDQQALSLVVNQPAVVIGTTTLPAGTRLQAYSQQLAATGGDGTYAWTVSAGTLPAGITLTSGGLLAGTPTVAGTFDFTVRATSAGLQDEQALSLLINQPGLVVSTTTLPTATQGVAYSTTLQATGGTGTYAWTLAAGTLPGGITLLGSGELSGTPTESGSFPITVRVTSGDQQADQPLTLVVQAPAGVRLGIVSAPGTGTAGQPLATVTVEILDAGGQRATDATDPVTLALGENPGGATLTGGGPVFAVAGLATFTAVTISAPGNGYTLVATSGSLVPDTTAAIDIASSGMGSNAASLAFLVQPTNVDRNAVISPPVQVEVRDAGGQRVTTASIPVTISIANNPGGGTLSGTLTRTSVNGVATFNDLRINRAGTGYTLRASASGLPAVTSASFRVR